MKVKESTSNRSLSPIGLDSLIDGLMNGYERQMSVILIARHVTHRYDDIRVCFLLLLRLLGVEDVGERGVRFRDDALQLLFAVPIVGRDTSDDASCRDAQRRSFIADMALWNPDDIVVQGGRRSRRCTGRVVGGGKVLHGLQIAVPRGFLTQLLISPDGLMPVLVD